MRPGGDEPAFPHPYDFERDVPLADGGLSVRDLAALYLVPQMIRLGLDSGGWDAEGSIDLAFDVADKFVEIRDER